ncbi:linear gramicidin synthetase subunit D domain protein, partial [Mycobacterium xenopi 4042]
MASMSCQPKSGRSSAGSTACWATPSGAGNRVRRLSWRATTSAKARPARRRQAARAAAALPPGCTPVTALQLIQ